jgi:hypothetical protein
MNRLKDYVWPLIGVAAVIWSVRLLYFKLAAEVGADPAIAAQLEAGGVLTDLGIIARVLIGKITAIPAHAFGLSLASAALAYLSLGWYDKLALMHLNKAQGIRFPYIATTAFVTYALAHNIGASVVSGGAVRYRAYTAKGLTGAEVAVLVVLCTFTFFYATAMMMGFAFIAYPALLKPVAALSPWFAVGEGAVQGFGVALLAGCVAYMAGSLFIRRTLVIKGAEIAYPRPKIVALQSIIAPLEIIGAAGIIYFALPAENHPGFLLVLGAFLLSFTAALVSQVPGGVGVMEAIFIALMPAVPASSVLAALLVWRLLYLILPLVISIPVVLLFERARYRAEHARGG